MSEVSKKVIRDKEFARRIAIACANHPQAPSDHGRQRWLMREMESRFHTTVSPEAVRKWFSGEARPRPQIMSVIARTLEVDEAWLSLGINPTSTPREKQKRNAMASGAVNLVAAQIQLAGGSIAFPEDQEDAGHDIFAIVRGKQIALTVKLADQTEKFTLSLYSKSQMVVAVVPTKQPTIYDFVRVPTEMIEAHGRQRGGYTEIEVNRSGKNFTVHDEVLPLITTFENIEGQKAPSLKSRVMEVRAKMATVSSAALVEAPTEQHEKPH